MIAITENTDMRTENKVPEQNIATVVAAVDKLNKRAVKLDLPRIVLQIGETVFEEYVDTDEHTGRKRTRMIGFANVIVTGESPKLNGYTFAATIEHTEAGNLLKTVPGAEVPAMYRTSGPDCDHCRTKRQRNETFVIKHDDGTFKLIGRQCLRDFLGHKDPHAIAEFATLLIEFGEMLRDMDREENFARGTFYYQALEVLTETAMVIRLDGWTSRKTAAEHEGLCATATTVEWLTRPPVNSEDRELRKRYDVSDSDKARAAAALVWAQNQNAETDYLWNLRIMANLPAWTMKNFGLGCSIIAAYNRTISGEVERAKAKTSEHFGTVGKREVFTVTVLNVTEIETQFGTSRLVIMMDKAGNKAKWFASSGVGMEIGGTYDVKATVKKHDVWNNAKQTALNRVVPVAYYENGERVEYAKA